MVSKLPYLQRSKNAHQQLSVNFKASHLKSPTREHPWPYVFHYLHERPSFMLSNTDTLLFVDDTKCFCNVSHPFDLTVLQNDLNSVVFWSQAWGLNFNPSKSIHLSFRSKINSTYHLRITNHNSIFT